MKNNYAVWKVVVANESEVDGNYWVGGGFSKEQAEIIAENLATIDKQTLCQIAMCDVSIKYNIVNDDTHKVVKTVDVFEEE